jgi:putative heme-binding domain-containing protein
MISIERFIFHFLLGVWAWGLIGETTEAQERVATSPESIRALPGFQVQRLRSAQEGESSWISMSFDDQGRILVGLDDHGVARLTINADQNVDFERLAGTESFRHVRGVLFAHQSLYVCATDSQEVHRLQDQDGDGQFETLTLLQQLPYASRFGHGTNQMVLGPDGMLYLVVGNDVQFPASMAGDSNYRGAQNDWLLPNPRDLGQDNRVGYIARVAPDGSDWVVLAGGLRNPFDLAINDDGELFTWDADMEWDAGLPWYRPTRLNHVIEGGEFGWRWGTGKWPAWYPDSLPTTLDTGFSSPTGMIFGSKSNWPTRYRQALFMADWQHGRMLMVDLIPQGATYKAESKQFLEGAPLNICDLDFGPDGSMYFITGGRGSQSGLYRVRWTEEAVAESPIEVAGEVRVAAARSRALRKKLAQLQRTADESQLDLIWQSLSSDDPWLSFSARVALENQPVECWRSQVETEQDSRAQGLALLALARVGTAADQPLIFEKLLANRLQSGGDEPLLSDEHLLLTLRTAQLSLIRQGEMSGEARSEFLNRLELLLPHPRFAVNWLAAELLVSLKSPDAIESLIQLLEQAQSQEEEIQFARTLVRIESGWNLENATRVAAWLEKSRGMQGGKLVEATWQNLRTDFESRFEPEIRDALSEVWVRLDQPLDSNAETIDLARPVVQHWTLADLEEELVSLRPEERSVESGQRALGPAACLRCHRIGDRGTHTGPDLTSVGRRYDARAILEAIIEPSKQVDPKYGTSTFELNDGSVVTGRVLSVTDKQLVVEVDVLHSKSVTIEREAIEHSVPNSLSPMPEGLLDTLTRDEILDLLAYLQRSVG